jgi:hypothetical protein
LATHLGELRKAYYHSARGNFLIIIQLVEFQADDSG